MSLRTSAVALFATIFCYSVSLQAATIEIQFSDLDIAYDGSSITDADPGGGDPDVLVSAAIFADDVLAGPVLTTDLSIDLDIPGVVGIPVGGGSVTSAMGGTIDLELGGGDHIHLDLDSVTVTYIDVAGLFEFVFGGSAATIVSQALPYGVSMGAPTSVSFSTQLSDVTDDGSFLTSFIGSGTGEIEGVPEPGALAILAIIGLSVGVMRKRLG